MPLQDLTPQLRTRLNRMERAVGWFVFVAVALLVFGFGYYVYHTAERRGWFVIKAPFHTFIQSSAGLNVGDPVYMMGFQVGQITGIHPMQPLDKRGVRLDFAVQNPYFRYLWTGGSYLKVNAAGFLNQRQLEVTRGTNGYALVVTQPVSVHSLDDARSLAAAAPGAWQLAQEITNAAGTVLFRAYDHLEDVFNETNAPLLAGAILESNSIYIYDNQVSRDRVVASWDGRFHHYKIFKPGDDTAWIHAVETPSVSDQLQAMIGQVQEALPRVLALTNQLTTVLNNTANATSNLNAVAREARPLLTNFTALSAQLREPGSLGVWALGTNGARSVVDNVNTNLILLAATLDHLGDITSNLNSQVQANSNMLGSISTTVGDADDFVQGLKHHWLLRSAFKKENKENTNAPPPDLTPPRMR